MSCSAGLVSCGCALGLTFGILIGKQLGRHSVPPAEALEDKDDEKEEKEGDRIRSDSVFSLLNAHSQNGWNAALPSGRSKKSIVNEDIKARHISAGIFNHTVEYLWPHLKRSLEDILRTTVQPQLQEKLPGPLKGLAFTTIDLGDEERCPLKIIKVDSVLDERVSREQGKFRCIHLVLGVHLESECDVQLQLGLGMNKLTAGVNYVKIRGSMVVELYHLLDHFPLFDAWRTYFSDKPDIDLRMIGGVGSLLNAGFLKNLISEVVLEAISGILVLPERMVTPMGGNESPDHVSDDPSVDIIRMKAPRPEGILRLVVKELAGLEGILPSSDTLWYLSFVVGRHSWRTPTRHGTNNLSFEIDNIVDFVVHDLHAQHIKVTLYPEVHSTLWGHYPGEALLTRFFRIDSIITDGVARWVHMQGEDGHASIPKESRRISALVTVSEGFHEDESTSCKISLCAEWGTLSRNIGQAQALAMGYSLFSGWTHSREASAGAEAVAVLLIGLRNASHLPQAQRDKESFWCVTSVTSAVAGELDMSVGSDGSMGFTSPTVAGERSTTFRKVGHQQACVCGNVFKNDTIFCRKCGAPREMGPDATHMLESSEVQATWNTAYYVPLSDLEQARLKVAVYSDKQGSIGTVQHNVSSLQDKPGLMEEYEDILISKNGSQDEAKSSMMQPTLHVMMRVWVLEAGRNLDGSVRDPNPEIWVNSARTNNSSGKSNAATAVENNDLLSIVTESPRKDKCECRVCSLVL